MQENENNINFDKVAKTAFNASIGILGSPFLASSKMKAEIPCLDLLREGVLNQLNSIHRHGTAYQAN